MVHKRPQNPADPKALNHADFRWFILHYPALLLKDAKIHRTTFVAVGMALAQFGDYATGTRVNPSLKLIRNLTGAHHSSIVKVIDALKACGALEVVDQHQGSNGGSPSEVFRFRRSAAVVQVLAKRDAQDWKRVGDVAGDPGDITGEPGDITGEPGDVAGEPGDITGEDNRKLLTKKNEMNVPVADAPETMPAALSPAALSMGEDLNEESGAWYEDLLDEMNTW